MSQFDCSDQERKAHLDQLCGTPEPDHAYGDAALYRLTNGFSKKVENHAHAVALHFMYYNFGRIHKTLRVTPAMEAGISDHVWSLEEIASLGERFEGENHGTSHRTSGTIRADK